MLGGATDKLRTRIDIKMTYFTVVIVINSTFMDINVYVAAGHLLWVYIYAVPRHES